MAVQIDTEVRPEIRTLLSRLRRRIRSYLFLDAIARLVVLAGVLFWFSFGMNWLYFQMSNLELPVWFRAVFGWLCVFGVIVFAGWLLWPVLRTMRARALALVLERRFGELDDRLITAVEVAESRTGQETELTAHMLENTIEGVSRAVGQLNVGEVFERRPRRRALAMAFVTLASVAALFVMSPAAMATWGKAFIDLQEVYWDRDTTFIVKVVAQPNDQIKDFLDAEGNPTAGRPGVYKHPRGQDLNLIIEVPRKADPVDALAARQRALIKQVESLKQKGEPSGPAERAPIPEKLVEEQRRLVADARALPRPSRLGRAEQRALQAALSAVESGDLPQALEKQKQAARGLEKYAERLSEDDWKVPDRVKLTYYRESGRGSVTLRRRSEEDRQFRHTLADLNDSLQELYVKGGDFANRDPYRILVVDPPQVDRIVLACDYPDYTRLDAVDARGNPVREERVVQGAQISLPMETDFRLRVRCNKPLVGVRLQSDDFEVALEPYTDRAAGSGRFTLFARQGQSRRSFPIPPETLWRFRRLPAETALHERFRALVSEVGDIGGGDEQQGAALSPETAAARRETLDRLAEQSRQIEDSYRKLLKQLDRNRLYPRLMTEGMEETIVLPLARLNRERFAAARQGVELLRQSGAEEGGSSALAAEAEKAIRGLEEAMKAVLAEMSNGSSFEVPFALRTDAGARLADAGTLPLPIPLAADAPLRIYLADTDDIASIEPTPLTINGIVDQPPAVETRLRGISSSITRKAVIPVTGTIADDYGIAKARFEFFLDDEQQWRPRAFRNPPVDSPQEFLLQRSPDDEYAAERFEVLPLDLSLGRKLTLTVYAQDGDNLNGPHSARGQRYTFTIVSNEELLSILYGKELNLRRRFERIIEEVEETRDDLRLHQDKADELAGLVDGSREPADGGDRRAAIEQRNTEIGNAAGRAMHRVAKNASETREVEQSFAEILEELVNNAVHTEEMVARIEGLIVEPLREITESDFKEASSAVNLFNQAHDRDAFLQSYEADDEQDPRRRIAASIERLELMLKHMKQVLAEMEDLVEFHEALKNLEQIIKDQSKLREQTEEERKKEAIEALKRLGLD